MTPATKIIVNGADADMLRNLIRAMAEQGAPTTSRATRRHVDRYNQRQSARRARVLRERR